VFGGKGLIPTEIQQRRLCIGLLVPPCLNLYLLQVIHSLSAQLGDELDLKIGQLVRITHIIDKDWYRSVCETGTGQFVRLIQVSL
jgi:hypothetical protein